MTDYNDGKWHGWNGSAECPVHHLSEVQVGGETDKVWPAKRAGHDVAWSNVIVFRVTKAHREPREWWLVKGYAPFCTREDADKWASDQYPVIHVREVLE